MRTKGIIQSLVGTEKIVVKDIFREADTNAIVIQARPTKREQCRCGLRPALPVRSMALSLLLSLGHGMAPGSAGALKKPLRG